MKNIYIYADDRNTGESGKMRIYIMRVELPRNDACERFMHRRLEA